MKKEELFEALGEISSRTVQANTVKRYRARILVGYVRWAAVAAAIIVVGTGIYVFRIADSTHGGKEEILGSGKAGAIPQVETEEAAPVEEPAAEEPAMEDTAGLSGGAYISADYDDKTVGMPVAATEAAEEAAPAEDKEARGEGTFGLIVNLPENPSWIQGISRTESENLITIGYKDCIAGAECSLYGVNSKFEKLPEFEFEVPFDDSLDETWEGAGPDGKTIYVKVKHSEDNKTALINWDYKEYRFEIVVHFTGDDRDASPIAKTALSIIHDMKEISSGGDVLSDKPSHTENAGGGN